MAAAAGTRDETARIAAASGAPDAPMNASVKLSVAPPIAEPPISVIRSAPSVTAAAVQPSLGEIIPTAFYWALLAVSAILLLIQLGTYFS